jgi:hypothetical protein
MSGIMAMLIGASQGGIAPVNTVAPAITGTATVGNTLSCSTGTWTGTPTPTYTYQWQKGTTNISGATSSTYLVDILNSGSTIRCVVTATNSAGSASANSANTASVPVPSIGTATGGGYYAGQISTAGTGVANFYLIIAPKASGEGTNLRWKTNNSSTAGTSSLIDGPTNSANMNNAAHPAAQFCEGLSIGGYTDWYMPATNELEICYFNLKPTTQANNTLSGTNTNAVPSRGSSYTSGTPARTSVAAFQSTGAEAFASSGGQANYYWASTQYTPQNPIANAWRTYFFSGYQYGLEKNQGVRVRATRRVAV